MARCENCKNFGLKGNIGSLCIPYCFKNKQEVKDTNTKRTKCTYFDYKYVNGRLFKKGSRKRRHGRRAGGGF